MQTFHHTKQYGERIIIHETFIFSFVIQIESPESDMERSQEQSTRNDNNISGVSLFQSAEDITASFLHRSSVAAVSISH